MKMSLMATLLNKLKELVRIEGCSFHFTFINIQLNSNNTSEKFTSLNDGKTLGINLEKLTPTEIEDLKNQILQVVDDGAILLEDKSKERIDDIESKEQERNEKELLAFFKGKIPDDDYTALRASLYLKKRFEEGADKNEISDLKTQIIWKFSRRGRNISDLCSSGYFETLIKTIFEEKERSGYSDEDILSLYNLIVAEGTLTVFVSTDMSPDQVQKEIEGKIRRNKRYGLHVLNIHGIGRTNIETIRTVIDGLKDMHPTIKSISEESGNIISVKLQF